MDPPSYDYAFGPFVLSAAKRSLHRSGVLVAIGSRAFDILQALLERSGNLVAKQALIDAAWPSTLVSDGNLTVHISTLRRLLGDDEHGAPFIKTSPGHGYTFVGAVTRTGDGSSAVHPDDRIDRPAVHIRATTLPAPLRSLPANLSAVIGREAVILRLSEALGRRRLLSLVGPGGVGKTTVALEVTHRVAGRYTQTVFVDLSSTRRDGIVGHAVATALGIALDGGDPVPVIAAAIGQESVLIVLDNCEHLTVEVAAFVEGLCASSDRINILITSREPLHLSGELVFPLPSLSFPIDPAKVVNTEMALAFSSVSLFVGTAQARNNDYVFTDESAPFVAEICSRLEGMPLAIELAASWSDIYPPRALAERLDGRMVLRARGRRGAPVRQQTLQATMDWSHDLLEVAEQRLFRRLSIFAGAFSPAAALEVASDEGLAPGEALEALAGLTWKSLVATAAGEGGLKHRLLMAPRTYARDKLEASGELATLRQRHLIWVLSALERAGAEYGVVDRRAWLRQNVWLLDEVRTAGAWAVAEDCALPLALTLAGESMLLWFQYSLTFEGRALVEAVAARLAAAGGGDAAQQMRLTTALAVAQMFTRAPNAEVTARWSVVLSHAEALDDIPHQMTAHWGLWLMARFRSDQRVSLRHAEAFAGFARRRESAADQATAERLLTGAQHALSQFDAARKGSLRVLEFLNHAGQDPGVVRFHFDPRAQVLSLLSKVYWIQGENEAAVRCAREAVDAAETAGHGLTLAFALLDGLAHTGIVVGDPAIVYGALDRLGAVPEAHGLRASEAVEALRALALADEGFIAEAASLLATLFSTPGSINVAGRFPSLMGRVADILAEGGHRDLGLEVIGKTLDRFVHDEDDVSLPELLRAKGVLLAEAGSGAEGSALLHRALDIASRHAALALELRIRLNLAALIPDPCLDDLADACRRFGPGRSLDMSRAAHLLAKGTEH